MCVNTLIIMMTARDSVIDRVSGLIMVLMIILWSLAVEEYCWHAYVRCFAVSISKGTKTQNKTTTYRDLTIERNRVVRRGTDVINKTRIWAIVDFNGKRQCRFSQRCFIKQSLGRDRRNQRCRCFIRYLGIKFVPGRKAISKPFVVQVMWCGREPKKRMKN